MLGMQYARLGQTDDVRKTIRQLEQMASRIVTL